MITFTEEDYEKMEVTAKNLLGWDVKTKLGVSIRDIIEDPEKGKEILSEAKKNAGFIDRIKIGKVINYLNDPNWKSILKSKLS